MPRLAIDLRSDTKTRPTAAMRQAMVDAEVGDEQFGEDPTVLALCERVAGLLGTEAAVFLPSGTMCNHIAILVHCRPGDEIIAADVAHIFGSESAGSAALAGVQIRTLPTERGIFTAEQVEAVLRARSKRNAPLSRMIEIEQTVNRGAGAVWSLDELERLRIFARRHELVMHMDGARLLNAAVAKSVPASRFAETCDSAWIDLSKGLGCPVGAVLGGSTSFIDEAWRWKHRLGGAMRQAGVLAAAGLYALDNHVERLVDDHRAAARLAEMLREIRGVRLVPDVVETNIVFFDIEGTGWKALDLANALSAEGIGIGVNAPTRLRAVTHLDVSLEQVEKAAATIATILAAPARG